MDDSSIQLFGSLATVGFGFLGFVGAAEIVRAAEASAEEQGIFNSIVILCCVLSAGSLLPLILSDIERWLLISTIFLCSTSVASYGFVIIAIARGKTTIKFPLISYTFLFLSAIVLALLVKGVIFGPSITVYKLSLAWLATTIAIRFALFSKVLLSQRGPDA